VSPGIARSKPARAESTPECCACQSLTTKPIYESKHNNFQYFKVSITLEIKFSFKKSVQHVRVLAALTVINLRIHAHNSPNPGTDGIGKRPHVKLVHRTVINVRGEGFGDVKTIARSFSYLPEVFLFIS
jgi:hypothetical protein